MKEEYNEDDMWEGIDFLNNLIIDSIAEKIRINRINKLSNNGKSKSTPWINKTPMVDKINMILEDYVKEFNEDADEQDIAQIERIIKPENLEREKKFRELLELESETLRKEKEMGIEYIKRINDGGRIQNLPQPTFESANSPTIVNTLNESRFLLKFHSDELSMIEPVMIEQVHLPTANSKSDTYSHTTISIREIKTKNSNFKSLYSVLRSAIENGVNFDYTVELLNEKGKPIDAIIVQQDTGDKYGISLSTNSLSYKSSDLITHSLTFKTRLCPVR